MFGSFAGICLSIIYYMVFQAAGFCLVCRFMQDRSLLFRVLFGSVAGSFAFQWIPVIFAFIFDFTLTAHIIAFVLPVAIVIYGVYKRYFSQLKDVKEALKEHKIMWILTVIMLCLWGYLLSGHTLQIDEEGAMHTGQCTYGDMNMHLGFITSIAKQQTFPPDYSIFPGVKLAYPFLSDSISSSFIVIGASLKLAYTFPMIIAFMQIIGVVYLFALTYCRDKVKAIVAWVLFFLNGGFGFIYFFSWTREGGLTLKNLMEDFYKTPTNLVDENIRWVNIIADMFLPQRATLFGYAVLFPALYLLYEAVFRDKKRYFVYAAILAGGLPLVHTHSFLGFGLISASWMLYQLYVKNQKLKFPKYTTGVLLLVFVAVMSRIQIINKKEAITPETLMRIGIISMGLIVIYGIVLLCIAVKNGEVKSLLGTWGIFLLITLALSMPQLILFTFNQVSEGGFVRGYFNWGNQGDSYISFYVKNIGLPLILFVAAAFNDDKKYARLYLPTGVVLLLAELIVFTPNTYDNNKLLYIIYLFVCMIVADYAVELFRKLKGIGGRYVLAIGSAVVCVLSAVLTLAREVKSDYVLYGHEYVECAQYVEDNTKVTDCILTGSRHNNEIASLTGRNIVCGADTFLYFHGIKTSDRRSDVISMYENPANSQDLFDKYEVKYIQITPYELNNFTIDEAYFDDNCNLVFSSGEVKLYAYN